MTVEFNGIKQNDFQTEIEAAAADDAAIADLESELKMKPERTRRQIQGPRPTTLQSRPRRRWGSSLRQRQSALRCDGLRP